jgi:acyl carrier protein
VDPHWVRVALKEGRPERLLHVYGPTESTTFATWEEVKEVDEKAHTIAIGRPVANTRAYVLDADQEPVPVGVPGELYLGGDGLARGYLNRAELTAERFIPDGYSGEYGARLYRTGDMVRYVEDGKIEFIGRGDEQVKLRGYRIELGEIEAILREHPSMAEAVVIASTEEDGAEKRLVAYVVGGAETQPSVGELRQYLKERLPEYMIPSAFVSLQHLPLTPNGKVDRRALPAPELSRAEMEGEYVAPRNAVEEMLAGIWAEVLKAERISIYDNFFEIGGHSLLATQVISRVNSRFDTKLPLHIFFESPTLVSLAAAIERSQADHDKTGQAEIQRVARGGGSIEQLVAELDELSESEVKALLADQR